MKKSLLLALFLVIIIAGSAWIFVMRKNGGLTFTEDISPTPSPSSTPSPATAGNDTISVMAPTINGEVSSPLKVTGQARGTWYFEASFPVSLLDANGKVLAQTPAHAQGEWMTQDFVPFTATLTFKKPVTETGTLVLEKDNPSGLAEYAAEIQIPIRFQGAAAVPVGTCFVGGCSNQIRSDEPNVVSTCEYRSDYACYKTAKCERQSDGQCGWTQNPQLTACLKSAKPNPGSQSQQLMPQ